MVLVSSVCSAAPDPASHSLTVLSHDTDASTLPSGEKVTALTGPEWPSSVCSKAFQSFSISGNVVSMHMLLEPFPDKALSWCKHECTAVYLLRGLLDYRPVV